MSVKGNDRRGDVIEGYRLVEERGMSFAGRSFLGESIAPTAPHERVVIQLWDGADQPTQQQPERLRQKLTQLQQMDHPHIVPMLAVGIHKGVPYSITEFLSCESLSDLLQRNPSGQPLPQERPAISSLCQSAQSCNISRAIRFFHSLAAIVQIHWS